MNHIPSLVALIHLISVSRPSTTALARGCWSPSPFSYSHHLPQTILQGTTFVQWQIQGKQQCVTTPEPCWRINKMPNAYPASKNKTIVDSEKSVTFTAQHNEAIKQTLQTTNAPATHEFQPQRTTVPPSPPSPPGVLHR